MEHATLDDSRESNPSPSYSVTTPETLDVIEDYFKKSHNASFRMAAAVLELDRETFCLVLRKFPKLNPYKVQVRHRLEEQHKEKRLAFARQVVPMIHADNLKIDNVILSLHSFFGERVIGLGYPRFSGSRIECHTHMT